MTETRAVIGGFGKTRRGAAEVEQVNAWCSGFQRVDMVVERADVDDAIDDGG
jgi:hypothetical protein